MQYACIINKRGVINNTKIMQNSLFEDKQKIKKRDADNYTNKLKQPTSSEASFFN